MTTALSGTTTQAAALASVRTSPPARTSLSVALASYLPPSSKLGRTSDTMVLAPYSKGANVKGFTSAVAVLAAYQTGLSGITRSRAWTFTFDGHDFYVLNLGDEGTWVFDFMTSQWMKWETAGFGVWNFNSGKTWAAVGKVVGLDTLYTFVWHLDPDAADDEGWRSVDHVAMGIVPLRTRDGRRCDVVYLDGSLGFTSDTGAQIKIRWSDDNGNTWSDYRAIDLDTASFNQRLSWRSLGQMSAPGRIFEVSDSGGMVRIDGMDVIVEGVKEPEGQK